MGKQTIAIACDHAGVELKEILKAEIAQLGFSVEDFGANIGESVDYPDYANTLAQWIKSNKDATGPNAKGILICGSGIGMSIAANRHKEVRAALCGSGLEAQLARKHNNANVLCLGARIIGSEVAKDCLKQFLNTDFEGGRHQKRVDKLG